MQGVNSLPTPCTGRAQGYVKIQSGRGFLSATIQQNEENSEMLWCFRMSDCQGIGHPQTAVSVGRVMTRCWFLGFWLVAADAIAGHSQQQRQQPAAT